MDILKEVILYVISASNGNVSRTRIVKLLYLIDFFSLAKFGSKVTEVNYNYYYYGPYSESIINCVDELKNSGKLQEYVVQNSFGNHSFLYGVSKPYSKITNLSGSEGEIELIDEIIKDYSHMNFKQLLEFVYSTPPIEDNKQGKVDVL